MLPSPNDPSQPLVLTPEQATLLVRWYAVDERGRFIFRRGCSRRSKGWGKSPLEAAKAIAELAGDVRFDGWDADGAPVGRPWGTMGDPPAWVQIAAVSEDQTDNTYSALYHFLSANNGRAADALGIDLGLTRCFLPALRGKLEPVTAAAGTREGQRVTYAVMDEALALDTPIPTPTGWTTMGDVAVGDTLIGADGMPTRVLKVTEIQDDRLCYRVTFADRTSVVTSAGHLWFSKMASNITPPTVRTTEHMARYKARYRVPRAKAAKTPDLPLPIDAYLLGLWLGDGSRGQGYITATKDDADFYIRQIKTAGEYARYRPGSGHRAGMVALGYPRGPRPDPPSIKQRLRLLGILHDKYVPAIYLRASVDQRVALLQGLMDSDGFVSRQGGCTFINAELPLVEGVVELLRSLGQTAAITWRADARARSGGCYKVNFTPTRDLVPFRLPRKVERVREHSRGPEWISIISIEPMPTVPVRCVAVDAPDHLFLAGEGWHVTHNTHLWTPQNGGLKLARTLRRNVAKMGGRSYETTNSYAPGERSVAEGTHKAAMGGAAGLFYDAVEAPPVAESDPDSALRQALTIPYADSSLERGGWIDLDRLVLEIRDPETIWEDSQRFYFNHNVDDRHQAVEAARWAALARPDITVPAGAYIGAGFDGSISDDCTALIGCTLVDGRPHLFQVEVWQRPEKAPQGWRIPRLDVRARQEELFGYWRVGLELCDPAKWATEIEDWSEAYNADEQDRVVVLDTNQASRFWRPCDRFSTLVAEGALSHDGSPLLTDQVLAMYRRKVRVRDDDDDGRTKFVFVKGPDGRKIDAGVAAVLALEAAMIMPPLELPPAPATARSSVTVERAWRPTGRLKL